MNPSLVFACARRSLRAVRHGPEHQAGWRRCCRYRRLPVALACAVLCTAALPAALEWTGSAPVYVVQGDFGNGYTSMEFENVLDWQGFCNSHATATCSNVTYWDVGANWTGGAVPSFADTVVTPVGSVVVVNNYDSVYQGYVDGYGEAAYLNAQGTLAVGSGAVIKLGGADINNLVFSGQMASNGLVNVSSFSGDLGRLVGTGTTRIQSIAGPSFNLNVGEGQHLIFGGNHTGSIVLYGIEQATLVNEGHLSGQANKDFTVYLSGTSHFENSGTLSAKGVTGSFAGSGLIGTDLQNQNRVHNTGVMEGSFLFSGARFDNDGDVRLAQGDTFQALADGTHGGNFQADAGSVLHFGSSTVAGQFFLPGSSIQSAGTVVFANGNFAVQGGYSASDTVVGASFANLTFSGVVSGLGTVTVNDGSALTFSTAQPVNIGRLVMTGATYLTATFNTPGTSVVQTVQLRGGGARLLSNGAPLEITQLLDLDGGSVANVDIGGALLWANGSLGSAVVRGSNTWVDGTRSLFGDVTAETDTTWSGGNFSYWSNTFSNPVGKTVDMQGDFNIAAGEGRFDNQGMFRKSAGAGTASIGVAFDNSGSVVVDSGTLVLAGGGRQSGSFVANPGGSIGLGGDLVIASTFTRQGAVGIDANSLQLLPGTTYTNALGEDLKVRSLLSISESSVFVNASTAFIGKLEVQAGGPCPTHCGSFTNTVTGTANVVSFDNGGNLVNETNGKLYLGLGAGTTGVNQVGATLTNQGELLMADISVSNLGEITNLGSLTTSGSVVITNIGLISNQSQLTNTGSLLLLDGTGVFDNRGQIGNSGSWQMSGVRVDNINQFDNSGTVLIDSNASLVGPGSYHQTAGVTTVYGLLQSDQDIVMTGGTINGPGTVRSPNMSWGGTIAPGNSPGVLTIDGNLTFVGTPALPGASPNLEIEVASPSSFDTLRVTGAVALKDAVVEFRFLSGYAPKDGDNVTWLQAGSIIDNCQSDGHCPTFYATGLPVDWEALPVKDGNGMRVEVITEPATLDMSSQIVSADALTIAQGEVASNWTTDPGATNLRSLDNSGGLYNRPNAWLAVYDNLYNRATGVISNRGYIENSYTVNEGILRIRPGAEFVNTAQFTNTGEVANHGLMSAGSLYNSGGHFDNSGTLTAVGLANSGSATFDNSGTLTLASLTNTDTATFNNSGTLNLPAGASMRNEAQFTVSGTVSGGYEIFNAGGTFVVTSTGVVQGFGRYRDEQGVTHVDGRLEAGSITLERGRVEGQGTLAGATMFIDEKLALPNQPGVLTIDGDLTLQYGGFYEVELAGGNLFTGLHVTGQVHSPALTYVQFLLVGGYLPQIGDSFDWLVADGGFDGQALHLGGIYSYQVINGEPQYIGWTPPSGMEVSFQNGRIGFTVPVPEPATWLLWLAGGLTVLSLARRRTIRTSA